MKHKIIAAAVALVAVFAVGYQANASDPLPLSINCPTGVPAVVYPGDSLRVECGATPTPTSTPTPSATQTPTPAPTTVVPAPTGTPSATRTSAPPTSTTPTTPAPSPTTTARLTNCMPRLDACGYPSPTTTGVAASVTLQPYLGPLRISAAGAVIDGKNLPCLQIAAANVTIRNSRISGPCFWGLNVSSGSLRLENSTVDCVNYQGTGIGGSHWTVIASQLLRCENGADVAGGNNTIQDSYIADVREVNGGHGDGIQAYTAGAVLKNVVVKHNTFNLINPITSSLIMGYPAENLLVEDNFFSAGAYTVYCPNNQPITNVAYRNNRFFVYVKGAATDGTHQPTFGYSDGCVHPGQITWTGNYRDSDLGTVAAA